MLREYFCVNCGLYHFTEVTQYTCPNEECLSNNGEEYVRYACDTFGYIYFYQANKEAIDKIAWSSLRFADEKVIERYRQQGVTIKQ